MAKPIFDKKLFFTVFGAVGGLVSGTAFEGFLVDAEALTSWSVGTAFDGMFIAALLAVGQARYTGKGFDARSILKALGIGGIGGLIGGTIALYLGFPLAGMLGGAEDAGRFIGWALGGLAVGFAVSKVVPNLRSRTSSIAGAIGGFAGCALMYAVDSLTMGTATTGAAIGLSIALAEQTFRHAWLEVTVRPKGMSLEKVRNMTVSLGDEDVVIGCGTDTDVRVAEVAGTKPILAKVTLNDGQVVLQDLASESSRILSPAESFEVSNATFILKTKS